MLGRSKLVRLLIEKESSDQALLESSERDHWYSIDFQFLNDSKLKSSFIPSTYDDETEQYLSNSFMISNNVCLQIYYSFMASFLSFFLTKTNINGILNRGNMFLFSKNFLQKFLNLPSDWSAKDKRLIDIGAGDGAVTIVLQHFFNDVTAVEASKVMEWRLALRNFKLLSVDKWPQTGPYNLISALNLLDRHYSPTKLFKNLHYLASSNDCFVLLSIVLPLNFYVEFKYLNEEGNKDELFLPFSKINNNSFEKHVEIMVNEILIPTGFEVVRWTKLPYFSEGDLARAYYKLDDAVFLLRAV